MSSLRIPTTPDVDSTLRVQLDSTSYSLRIVWSQRGECFHLHIADSTGVQLLSGLRMVTLYPLLYRYHYMPSLPIGELYFIDTADTQAKPTLAGMGDRFRLYYVTDGQW
jgi:hypothetical protein